MSSLSKIVSDVTDAHETNGVINRQAAIDEALPRVMADEEMATSCVRAHLSRLIATNAKSRVRDAAAADSRQSSMFGLQPAHVIDDGEGSIKQTRALSRLEFASLIRVRQESVEADIAYLDKLRKASTATSKLWDRHPQWTWGQVEDAYARQQAAA